MTATLVPLDLFTFVVGRRSEVEGEAVRVPASGSSGQGGLRVRILTVSSVRFQCCPAFSRLFSDHFCRPWPAEWGGSQPRHTLLYDSKPEQ